MVVETVAEVPDDLRERAIEASPEVRTWKRRLRAQRRLARRGGERIRTAVEPGRNGSAQEPALRPRRRA